MYPLAILYLQVLGGCPSTGRAYAGGVLTEMIRNVESKGKQIQLAIAFRECFCHFSALSNKFETGVQEMLGNMEVVNSIFLICE